jgi:hypothetical protein
MLNGFLEDMSKKSNELHLDESKPLYIIELGAGLGKFSFHLFSALMAMKDELNFPISKVVYVMTDFTDSNFQAWQSHPGLKEYFETGNLDAAIFNAVEDSSILLHKSQIRLSVNSVENPLIIVANYLFDTLYHDIFQIELGELKEGLVSSGSTQDEHEDPLNPDIIGRLANKYKYIPTTPSYYRNEEGDEKHLEWVLRWYHDYFSTTVIPEDEERVMDGTVLIPIGAIRALRRLAALSGGRALILSSDKGSANVQSFHGLSDVSIAVHGSFSLMVNYHAIALWVASKGGYFMLDPHENSDLLVNAFILSPPSSTSLPRNDCSDQECQTVRYLQYMATLRWVHTYVTSPPPSGSLRWRGRWLCWGMPRSSAIPTSSVPIDNSPQSSVQMTIFWSSMNWRPRRTLR